jgi:hypothetical protein
VKKYKPYSFSLFGVGNEFANFDEQVCIFIDGFWFNTPEFQNSKYKILISGCEPPDIYNNFYTADYVIQIHKQFDLILAADEKILNNCSNAILFPFGSCWVTPNDNTSNKTFGLSFLSGIKNELPGHKLRHAILNNITIPSSMLDYYFIYKCKNKEFLEKYQYSIIIENTQHKNYFTEKIIDAFVKCTIPIYWGCPNIGDFFDKRGIITFNNLQELQAKLNLLTPELYSEKIDIVKNNYQKALTYSNFHERVSQTISNKLKI